MQYGRNTDDLELWETGFMLGNNPFVACLPCITIKRHHLRVHQKQMAWPVQGGQREILEVGLFPLKCDYLQPVGQWPDGFGIVSLAVSVTNFNNAHHENLCVQISLVTSAELNTEWQALHPLSELVDSNSKQESSPWIRPEAAQCSLEASESESCCQATVYR